ncbi:helix-turn-helix transcriptional regulator [Pseudonocardia xishanensis]|uniref:Helix-turn-helix transcriptional regulator n=1 Tax=Pseudonocardia xishanensis TaxID=630995 RepID=A0ABP8RCP5_9PSEU
MARNAVVGRLRLASGLRRHRLSAGLTLDDVAQRLECSPAKVSRMETGAVGANVQDVRAIAELLGLGDAERELMTELAREARSRGWWQEFADVVPAGSATFYGLEDGAARIEQHTTSLVPGLLQTRGYARALLESASAAGSAVVERRLELRMRRQQVLSRQDRPAVTVLLDEAVLHRPVGGLAVMAEQLSSLLAMSSASTVDLRILPFSAGAHASAGVGFSLFGFDDRVPPVVFAEQLSRNLFVDDPGEVQIYRRSLMDSTEKALAPEATRDMISGRLRALR